jgi:hypothetical protein
MTRKDYELIAGALNDQKPYFHQNPDKWGEYQHCFLACRDAIADALAADNPRFDRDKFLKACGL